MYLENMTCVIFFWDQNQISGRSPQVVKTKKTRSAAVINFQVVSRLDGCSKVHSRRIWYSMFLVQDAFSLRMLLFLALWALPLCSLCPAVFRLHGPRHDSRPRLPESATTHDSEFSRLHDSRLLGVHDHDCWVSTTRLTTTTGFGP